VVRVGKVDACRADFVELLTGTWGWVGKVDDVHDLGAAEAGDLYGTHAGDARGSPGPDDIRSTKGFRAVPVPTNRPPDRGRRWPPVGMVRISRRERIG
jgi:hypothetical protein